METWQQLRIKREIVPWSKVVSFSQGIPRYSFLTWLAVKNKLSTGDRMRSWGVQQHCTLCGEPDETRDHLVHSVTLCGIMWLVGCWTSEWIQTGLILFDIFQTLGSLLWTGFWSDWCFRWSSIIMFGRSAMGEGTRNLGLQQLRSPALSIR